MIALGAALVADDLCLLEPDGDDLRVRGPDGAPATLEARGIGLLRAPLHPPAPVAALLRLAASPARLPAEESERLCGHDVPLLRHPATWDLPAKLMLWLRRPLSQPTPHS